MPTLQAVSMNLNGNAVMGYTPRHKLQQIQDFLKDFPDVVMVQDSVELVDITPILEAVSDGAYDYHFTSPWEDRQGGEWEGEAGRSVTGIAWNRNKYFGSPLQLEDFELKDYAEWLRRHDLTVVRLDSKSKSSGWIDEHPSFVGIAWHGPDYDMSLRERIKVCEEFYAFVDILRSNNCKIPVLIGGDFNMDMRSFPSQAYPEFGLVPYRPSSAKVVGRDLKNTFVFMMDCMQITETSYKQAHPEVFTSPFITVIVRGRIKMKIWAIVRLQRMVKRFLKRRRAREANRRKMEDNKSRWKKKINGEDFSKRGSSRERRKGRSHSRRRSSSRNGDGRRSSRGSSSSRDRRGRARARSLSSHREVILRKEQSDQRGQVTKNRKYRLYWDEKDDPNYVEPEYTEEEREKHYRKTLDDGSGRNVMDAVWYGGGDSNGAKTIDIPDASPYRRKRFDDLKSMQQRKKEKAEAEAAFDYSSYYM